MSTVTETDDRPMLRGRVRYGEPVHNEVMDFLIEEARLLDLDLLDDWLESLTDDLLYVMPVRETITRGEGSEFDPAMCHLEEDIDSIRLRVQRILHTRSAYAEDPPSRVRRSVSNVRVHETDVDGELFVESHVLLLRNRWDLPSYDTISALREDVLRRHDDGFRLARRRILVDQATLGTPNLAIFL